jgi:hypothetical protein
MHTHLGAVLYQQYSISVTVAIGTHYEDGVGA